MSKGGDWEIRVARDITEMLTEQRNPPALWRSTQSGGWAHRDVPDVGDLRPITEEGQAFREQFAIECKHNKNEPQLWRLFTSRKNPPPIIEWWVKLEEESREYKLIPLLVMQRNFRPALVAMPVSFFYYIKPESTHPSIHIDSLYSEQEFLNLSLMLWKDFLQIGLLIVNAGYSWRAYRYRL